MKICIVTHTFPKNPNDTTAAFMHPLVLGLKSLGNEVVVLTPYHRDLRISDFPYKIVTYKYIWPNFLHVLGYSQTLKDGTIFRFYTYLLAPLFYFFGFLALLRLIAKEKFDIVSSHWILPNGFIAYLTSRFIKVPYTVSLAGSDVYVANKNFLFSFMARISARSASAICADSPKYVDELRRTGVKIGKVHIINYPVDTSKVKVSIKGVQNLRKKMNLGNAIILLAVGRLIYKKGFEYLLKALPTLVRKNKNIVLLIIGDGDLKEQLKKLALELGVENHVKFIGSVQREEIFFYYNLVDIFVMPSIEDDNGNIDDRPVALLEAIACGKAVVATNFPGNALTIKDGVNGYLVPQKNYKAMSGKIWLFAQSKELRTKMGKMALKTSETDLSSKMVAQKYVNLFKRIAN